MKLSIVVPTLNCLSLTRQLLTSFEDTKPTISYEVIIIDNASTDGTREFLGTLKKPYRVVFRDECYSYGANNNLGAEMANGELLVLLNNDLILTQNWLEPMLKLIESFDNIGCVGNIQLRPETGLIDHAGIAFNLDGVPFHIHKNRKKLPSPRYRECNAVTGACIVIKKEIFKKIGGFDERYRNGSEDIDLCMRLRRAGYRILVSYESKIYHKVSSSRGRLDHVDTNMALFLKKWQPLTSSWGQLEWPYEYFHRYARHFWKMTPSRVAMAFYLLCKNRFLPGASPAPR